MGIKVIEMANRFYIRCPETGWAIFVTERDGWFRYRLRKYINKRRAPSLKNCPPPVPVHSVERWTRKLNYGHLLDGNVSDLGNLNWIAMRILRVFVKKELKWLN